MGFLAFLPFFPPPVRLGLEEFLKQAAQPPGHASKGADTDHPAGLAYMVPLRVQHETNGGGELRIADVIGQTAYTHGYAASNRQIKYLLRDLGHPFENRSASCQHDAGVERLLVPRAPNFVPRLMEDFFRARLQNFR